MYTSSVHVHVHTTYKLQYSTRTNRLALAVLGIAVHHILDAQTLKILSSSISLSSLALFTM